MRCHVLCWSLWICFKVLIFLVLIIIFYKKKKKRLNPKEKEEAAEALVNHCRERWENLNKKKSNDVKNRIGDLPFIKYGCDDITVCIAFLYFVEEEIKLNTVVKTTSNSKKKT